MISGYNIYLGDDSSVRDTFAWQKMPGTPYNQIPYPGDTDGDNTRELIPLDILVNGRMYYAIVRTVGPDGRESASSNLAVFRPLAQGSFIISSNHEATDGGFNFEDESLVPGRGPRSDIYLYDNGEKVGLSSPNRLGAGMRKSLIFESSGDKNGDETVQISTGEKLIVKTKAGRAEITIEEIIGKYPETKARIEYIFYPDNPK